MRDLMTRAASFNGHKGIDLIMEEIDSALQSDCFAEVDALLNAEILNVSNYDLDLGLTVLTATFAAHDKLPSREAFFRAVKSHAIDLKEYEYGLLTGLSTVEDFWEQKS